MAGGGAALLYLGGVGVAGGAALLQLLRDALQLQPRPRHELLQELPPAAEPQVDGAAGHPPAQHTPHSCQENNTLILGSNLKAMAVSMVVMVQVSSTPAWRSHLSLWVRVMTWPWVSDPPNLSTACTGHHGTTDTHLVNMSNCFSSADFIRLLARPLPPPPPRLPGPAEYKGFLVQGHGEEDY